jgi:ABC-type lipoprotein release transport system permease subunit
MENDSIYSGGAFRVCGIYKTYNSVYDGTNVFIKKSDLKKISSIPENISHETAVRVPVDEDLEAVKSKILEKYPELSVTTWKESFPQLALVNDMMDKMIFVFLIIILLALGFGIVNTMLMAVLERIKEFGMLMAVGMSKIRVFKMIMYETIFLSAVGGIVGMLISGLILRRWGKNGISFDSMKEGFERFGYSAEVYPSLEPDFYFVLSFLIILTGILASVYPARKAVKLNPVEALRTE